MFNKFINYLIISISFISLAEANLQPKILVRSFKIIESELFDSFNAVGQIKFEQSRTYYANVEGRVDNISLKVGSNIKEGEVALVIDKTVAEALKSQNESAFKSAELAYRRN